MEPVPVMLAQLARSVKFPPPDDPTDPQSTFTLTVIQARNFGAVLGALLEYVRIEYARCGKQTTEA